MSAYSRSKGRRAEQELVNLARAAGLDASREWANAQHPDAAMRRCDGAVTALLDGRPAQVKVSGDGFGYLYDGLQAVEFLFVRADRRPWLAVVRAEKLLRLLKQSALRRRCYAAATPPPVHAKRVPRHKGRISAKAERQKERNAPSLTRQTFCDNKKGSSNEQANGKAAEGD